MSALEREIATYNAKLPELLNNSGKFVVIKGEEVEGVYESYSDALSFAYDRHPEGGFLVKRISATSQIANFTRDLAFRCPA